MAKELAGIFYEEPKRTPGFRAAFPTLRDYMRGHWHQPDGTIKQETPGWQHHVQLARRLLTAMLRQPESRVSNVMKNRIYDGLIEDRNVTLKAGKNAKKVTQAGIRLDA